MNPSKRGVLIVSKLSLIQSLTHILLDIILQLHSFWVKVWFPWGIRRYVVRPQGSKR